VHMIQAARSIREAGARKASGPPNGGSPKSVEAPAG
jgi:hypothetical protein